MSSLNHCSFIGRIGKIETRYTQSSDAITNFSVACGESYTDKSGQKVEKTEWITCVAYRKLAEIMEKYCSKGMQIYVSGKMQTRKWSDKNGIERYTTEIIVNDMKMLGSKNSGTGQQDHEEENTAPSRSSQAKSGNGFDDMDDDLIPF